MVRVGINGFGRIGRLVLRAALENSESGIEVVAINDLGQLEQNVHLFKYDSVHGSLPYSTKIEESNAVINNKKIFFYNKRNPSEIPWSDHNVDVVMECTGIFTNAENAALHLNGSVKKVLVSAPSPNADITVVYGVNHNLLNKEHKIISNASCTTNCLAPVAKVINDNFYLKENIYHFHIFFNCLC